jgi:hypothetical protein
MTQMESFLHNVNELPGPAGSAVESLLGHPLRDDQQLFIAALDSAPAPAVEDRRAAWDELQKIVAVMHENVVKSALSPAEIDRLIDAECDAVRYGASAMQSRSPSL